MHQLRTGTLGLCLIGLTACGDDANSGAGGMVPITAPTRGSLIQDVPQRLISLPLTQLTAIVAGPLGAALGAPKCGIDVYYLQYNTVGAVNESTTASGALMVPTGSNPACQGSRPVVLYAHGTSADRSYNIANFIANNTIEGVLLAVAFAAQGYVVVAPNYAGYDISTLTYHPFLNADQQSNDMIDALTAGRSALPAVAPSVQDSGKLFVTGYSQGGYVAMATHRALQAAGVAVTASAPMSGPYALSAFGDAVFYGNVILGAPVLSTLLVSSYQHAYGDLYNASIDIFEPQYANGIDTLLPSTTSVGTLLSEGKLSSALFSNTPPAPQFASFTPPTTPPERAALYALGFAADHLITNAYRSAYLQDAQVNPDGAWPMSTNELPPASPTNGLRRAFAINDLRNWQPLAPTLLCGGNADPTVLYLNTQIMQAYFAMTATPGPVTVLDVDSAPVPGDPYASLKEGFAAVKLATLANAVSSGATDGGASALQQSYHGGLVPLFCLAAARAFFDSH